MSIPHFFQLAQAAVRAALALTTCVSVWYSIYIHMLYIHVWHVAISLIKMAIIMLWIYHCAWSVVSTTVGIQHFSVTTTDGEKTDGMFWISNLTKNVPCVSQILCSPVYWLCMVCCVMDRGASQFDATEDRHFSDCADLLIKKAACLPFAACDNDSQRWRWIEKKF